MPWQIPCLILGTGLELAFAVLVWRRLRMPAANPFAIGLLMYAFWSSTYALELGVGSLEAKLLLVQLRSLFLPFGGLVALESYYRFAYGRSCLYGWRLAIASVIPVITAVLAWWPTPDGTGFGFHRLFRYHFHVEPVANLGMLFWSNGPWSVVLYGYTYFLILAGITALLVTLPRAAPWERTSRYLLVVACLCGNASILLHAIGHSSTPIVNYNAILLPINTAILATALFRGRLIDLAPVARSMLIENLKEMLIVLDRLDIIVDLNRTACRVLALEMKHAVGLPAARVLAPWPGLLAHIRRDSLGKAETTIGEAIWEVSVLPIADRKGVTQARMLILRDVTAERRAEADLRRAKEAAEAADRAKSRFLAMMSHEIRTPMNGVLGFNELLRRTDLTREQRDFLDLATQSGRALLVIIDDVLDYSKIEAGQLNLEEMAIELETLVAGTLRPLLQRAEAGGVALGWRIDADVPGHVQGDPTRIGQILTNLAGNALKFTKRGGRVDVRVARSPESGGTDAARICTLAIHVSDTGVGIAPEHYERIFRPFAQADDSITRRFGGTGLGLAISKRLCELMGGKLLLESELGRGSVFTAVLRLRIGTTRAAGQPAAAEKPSATKSFNLLVFEDNMVNRKLIDSVLKKMGHRAQLAENGAQGLAILETETFDAVLLDLEMPDMDGYEVIRRMREAESLGRRRHHVIALTAHAMKGEREKCLAAGMDDFVTKPIDFDTLDEALRRARP